MAKGQGRKSGENLAGISRIFGRVGTAKEDPLMRGGVAMIPGLGLPIDVIDKEVLARSVCNLRRSV